MSSSVTILFQDWFLCPAKVRDLQTVCETVLKFLCFGVFLNIHNNSTACSTPLNSVQVPQICCHHYMTPPGKLHTVQMQEFVLVEEHWHVFVVGVTWMHLDHCWYLYFMLWGADKVLGKVVPTLTEKVPLLLALSFSSSSSLYGQSQPSPSRLSSQADF